MSLFLTWTDLGHGAGKELGTWGDWGGGCLAQELTQHSQGQCHPRPGHLREGTGSPHSGYLRLSPRSSTTSTEWKAPATCIFLSPLHLMLAPRGFLDPLSTRDLCLG